MRMRLVIAALMCVGAVVAAPRTPQKKGSPPKTVPPPSVAPERPAESWPVWGGPRRNFISPSTGLANTWPREGPPRLWSRALGDGYSAIAEEKGVLFTAYRRGSKDVVVALDAANGKTVWEYEYDSPFGNAYAEAVGPGPYAMPQVIGDRVFTASGTGKIHSLDKRTGRPAWSHDLYGEFRATRLPFGYSCHGLPYKGTLIYLAGGSAPYFGLGRGSAVVAFRQSDGAVVWRNQAFTNAHSSPLLIDVDGQPRLPATLPRARGR